LSVKFVVKLAASLALAGGLMLPSAAQQTTTPAASSDSAQPQPQNSGDGATKPQAGTPAQTQGQAGQEQSQQKSGQKSDQAPEDQGKVQGTSKDRLFYALPNFLTLEKGRQLPPLSAKDKFKVVALGTFDYVNYPWWGTIAAISQAENSEPAYGQGWKAYAKRYGSTAGDSIIENFMVGAIYPSIIHQDPRFYYSPNGGFFRRTGYAITRIVVSRTDSGHAIFNFSEFFGSATAAAISTYTYHPKGTFVSTPQNPHLYISSEHSLANAGTIWGTQMGLDTITLVIKEFWPDVHHKMRKSKLETPAVAGSK
jgi:hypothetical protein